MNTINTGKSVTEFEEKLHIFMEEVLCVEDSYYSWKTIHNTLSEDKDVYLAVNRNGFFWQRVLNSFQVNFFMTLGRIFDSRDDSFSIYQLLRFCKNHKEVFSKEQLEKRKQKDLEPQMLTEDMHNIPVDIVKDEDIEKLEQEINKQKELFFKNYVQIRSAIFGHKSLKVLGKEDYLFSKTSIGEIETMLDSLNRVSVAIWELYHNGRSIDLSKTGASTDFKEVIVRDVEDVLKSLVKEKAKG